MTKEELETKLNLLRQKWIGHIPKDDSDPNWWGFKCDSCIASRLKRQIEQLKSETIKATSQGKLNESTFNKDMHNKEH